MNAIAPPMSRQSQPAARAAGTRTGAKPLVAAASGRKKVLIVDDHPLVREGLSRIINQQSDLVVCGEAGTASAGLFAMVRERPDVMIVDLSLEEANGLDLIKDVHLQKPGLPILALSMHREDLYGPRAIAAGARGYVMKSEPVDQVLVALRKLLLGQMAVSAAVRNQIDHPPGQRQIPPPISPAARLSPRELEIFRSFGKGDSTRKVAARLRVALSTVFAHRANIKRKLKLENATEMVSAATRFLAEEGLG